MHNSILRVLAISVAALPVALMGQPCANTKLQSEAQRVKALQLQLIDFKLHDDMDEEVPAGLRGQIRVFKSALTAISDAELRCTSSNPSPKSLESSLATLLSANKPVPQDVYDPKKPAPVDHIYGENLHVKVTTTTDPTHLVIVEYTFGIACGNDSVLLAYELRSNAWQRVLSWQSPDYREVSGAFGDFFKYVLLPPTSSESWRAVIAHGHPWCTSRWSGFDLDVVQPSTSAAAQSTLLHLNRGYVRLEIEPALKLAPKGFEIRLQTGMIDPKIMTRIGIYRYRVNGKEIERVQPIALNGRGFVDEWLSSPWNESSRWSSSANLDSLNAIHTKIEAERSPNANDSPTRTYGPVRACTDTTAHFQVEMDEESTDSARKSISGNPIYFQIQQGDNSFNLSSVSDEPDAHCTGPDMMEKK